MRQRIFFFVFFALCLSPAVLAAEAGLRVDGIRYGVTDDGARIVFDMNRKTDFRAFLLDKPYRLVVDLPPADWKTYKSRFVTNSLIKSYRSGALESGLTRVIFDMKQPAIVDNAFTIPKDEFSKNRLVIDMKAASAALFNARKETISGNPDLAGGDAPKKTASIKKPRVAHSYAEKQEELLNAVMPIVPSLKKPEKKYTIVVDPGHGGEDPGATEQFVKEKFVTLAVAKELRRQLEETGRYKVVLTRDKDFYVKLHERVDISRHVGGDLFISIHADKIDRKGVRGASIYTLSEKASDAETARLAEDENNAGFVAGVDLGQESQDVADILLDLAMREKMNESSMFARMLSQAFNRGGIRLLPNSHRSAGFAVLKAPDVPSVLIETGFLSNPEEAKLLSSGQFQSDIAASILDGVDNYFRKIKSLQKL